MKPTSTAHLVKQTLKLAIPLASSNLIITVSTFVGVLMLSKLGNTALAASALITPTQITLNMICMSILFSISVMVGNAYGAQKYFDIGGIVQQGWLFAALISIPLMIIMWYISPILLYLGQKQPLVGLVESYFHAYFWGVPALMWNTCIMQFALGILRRKLIFVISIVNTLIIIGFGYLLIFGKFGLPVLGIEGLGYANAIQCWVSLIGLLLHFYYRAEYQRYGVFQYRLKQTFHHLRQLFAIGWPIAVQTGGEMLSFFFTTMMVGWLGATALAARQITMQYILITVIPLFAITQATAILVSHANGAKRYADIPRSGNIGIILGVIFSLVILLLFVTIPKLLASGFVDANNPANEPIIALAVILFSITAFGQMFDSIRNICTGALRGLYDTKFPMLVSIFSLWIFAVPASYFMGFTLHWGVVGLLIAYNVNFVLGAGILLYRWHRKSAKVFSFYKLEVGEVEA